MTTVRQIINNNTEKDGKLIYKFVAVLAHVRNLFLNFEQKWVSCFYEIVLTKKAHSSKWVFAHNFLSKLHKHVKIISKLFPLRTRRSSPTRLRGFHAQSSNMNYFHREYVRIKRSMDELARRNQKSRPTMWVVCGSEFFTIVLKESTEIDQRDVVKCKFSYSSLCQKFKS